MIDDEGNTAQGRDAIEKVFAGILSAKPRPQMTVEIESIRFIGTALAIEAGVTDFWRKYVGLDGHVVGIDRFGASAPAEALFKYFGFTVDAVVNTAKRLLR